MAYFPMFLDMDNVNILLVGGGDIATHKLEKLLDFSKEITIIALAVNSHMEAMITTHGLVLQKREYKVGDIQGFNMVIIATDTEALHKAIYAESRNTKILVNSVDNAEYCDFIFPSYLQRGDLTVAFSTGGTSPAFAKQIRNYFDKIIPDSVGVFLLKMQGLRSTIPKGKERMRYFDTLVSEYFTKYFK